MREQMARGNDRKRPFEDEGGAQGNGGDYKVCALVNQQ